MSEVKARTRVEIIGPSYSHGCYEEGVTSVGGKIVNEINTSYSEGRIVMWDENNLRLMDMRVPDTCIIVTTYHYNEVRK